ncbi:MAG: S46 family peptidase [Bacteroidales bacterium]|nr:S46 family peptidase [Bacteroidales bacterium]
MRKSLLLSALFLHIIIRTGLSVEGMWIPLLIEKFNIKDMQEKGCRLAAEDIYSINKACLADAVILFGRGCTGEVISPDGLVLTNHHCGYSRIQAHSTLEKDYLNEGFWAFTRSEELPNPGLTASFLIRIEDVTQMVLQGTDSIAGRIEKEKHIDRSIDQLIKITTDRTGYNAEIKPFYFGKEYYMFVYQTFRDIRLVGAPPASIGKFGGDTDNWIWPRHTGDFSLFRIYADSTNSPADYSPSNIPYKPGNHLKISIKGIRENDFTMILGYPARTNEYLTSHELKIISNSTLPRKIELRNAILDIMKNAMDRNPEIKLKYASKYAGMANAWKKWIGVLQGFERYNTIRKKETFEEQFRLWLNRNPDNQEKYAYLLPEFSKTYSELEPYYFVNDYASEAIFHVELIEYVSGFTSLLSLMSENQEEEPESTINKLKSRTENFFKNYEVEIDKEIFIKVLELYSANVGQQFLPDFYHTIHQKFRGNYRKFADRIYKKSFFTDKEQIMELLDHYSNASVRKIISDPLFRIYSSFGEVYRNKIFPQYDKLTEQLDDLYPEYLAALMLMQPDKLFYPDANFTMRMTYGKAEGYSPADAVEYRYNTTLKGIIEKEDPEVYDYVVPEKLKNLYEEKDFGRYGANGKMPVCFIASNHTSGGNSGSPVLDADGYLVGLNFDRNWEGTMNDFMYDPDICRNISLDIRYVLFIIEKYAGADHIIGELTIID